MESSKVSSKRKEEKKQRETTTGNKQKTKEETKPKAKGNKSQTKNSTEEKKPKIDRPSACVSNETNGKPMANQPKNDKEKKPSLPKKSDKKVEVTPGLKGEPRKEKEEGSKESRDRTRITKRKEETKAMTLVDGSPVNTEILENNPDVIEHDRGATLQSNFTIPKHTNKEIEKRKGEKEKGETRTIKLVTEGPTHTQTSQSRNDTGASRKPVQTPEKNEDEDENYSNILILEEDDQGRLLGEEETNYEPASETDSEYRQDGKGEESRRGRKRAWQHEKPTRTETEKEPKKAKEEMHTKTCRHECEKKALNTWCRECKEDKLMIFKRTKDFGYNKPNEFKDMSLQWTMKKGIKKTMSKEQLPYSSIRHYKHEKRTQRFIELDQRIMHRSEGIDLDEAWNSYQDTRDQEGWKHMKDWYGKLNPVFTKRITNHHRCSCDTELCVGTVRQWVHHSLKEHSHINNREIECIECHNQGLSHRFMTAEQLWRHISNSHERLLMVGHSKCDFLSERTQRNNNETDRWMAAFSQMLVAATLEALNKENFLSKSFWEKDRKEPEVHFVSKSAWDKDRKQT